MHKTVDKTKLKTACDFHNERSREYALSTLLGISTKTISFSDQPSRKRSARRKLEYSHYATTAKNSSRLDFSYFKPKLGSQKSINMYQVPIHSLRTNSQAASKKKVRINKRMVELNTSLVVAPKVLVSQCESPKTLRNKSQQMFYFEDLSKIRHFSTISGRTG